MFLWLLPVLEMSGCQVAPRGNLVARTKWSRSVEICFPVSSSDSSNW